MTQCSTSEIGDAPLYNSWALPIQVTTTEPLPAPSKCKSGLPRITGTCPGWWKQRFRLRLWFWCGFKWGPHHATSHLRSWLESVPGCAEECGDPLVQSGGRWQTLGVAVRLGAGPQVQRVPRLASEGVLRLCTLSQPPSFPDLNPLDYFVWSYVENPLDYFVWSYIENITNMISHNTKASLIAAIRHPSIHRAPAGACGKGILPVPDPYRGGDWGWKRLNWIDVSSTT